MKTNFTMAMLPLAVAACGSTSTLPEGIVAPMVPYELADSQIDQTVQRQTPPPTENPSLWTTSATSLLSFGRAKDVGDLLTVIVEMDDQASLENSLSRTRSTSENVELDAFFALPEWAATFLPGGASLSPAIDIGRDSDLQGQGSVNRAERVAFRLASRIVGVEPTGNLIIQGYQETRISNEVRYLTVSGVIRAGDITRDNTITYDKIAEAKIAYISTGAATGAVNRGVVPQVIDKVIPF
ncbi:MAG: flagellar basal body L-ring protein FlgH [Hyphomonadaceae bacterium]